MKKNIEIHFLSIQELVKYCTENAEKSVNTSHMKTGRRDWYGTDTFDEAQELIITGCPDIVKKLEAATVGKQKGPATHVKPVNAIIGTLANVPATLAGVPESMIDYRRTARPAKAKIINIYYNVSVTWKISTDTVIEIGSNVLNLVSNLDRAGYQTNLFVCSKSKSFGGSFGRGRTILTTVKVKNAGSKFSISRLSYCFAHPSFNRRHVFCVEENNGINECLAGPADMTPADVPATGQNIIINSMEFYNNPAKIATLAGAVK